MQRLVLRYIRRLARRQRPQAFFERLHRLALSGMNIGKGTDFRRSGELGVLESLRDTTRDALVVFDVGANVGDYALAAHEILGDRARIFAFEPAREVSARLTSAVAGTSIEVVPCALGSDPGTQTLYAAEVSTKLASMYAREVEHAALKLEAQEEIEVERLDAFCRERGIEKISLLKLDVEGHELSVLESAGAMLTSGAIERIQFEFGGTNLDARTYFRDFYRLLRPRYRLYRVLRRGLHEITSYDESREIFGLANYFATWASLPAQEPA